MVQQNEVKKDFSILLIDRRENQKKKLEIFNQHNKTYDIIVFSAGEVEVEVFFFFIFLKRYLINLFNVNIEMDKDELFFHFNINKEILFDTLSRKYTVRVFNFTEINT
ncbi:MAG: hypothetical protein WCW29_03330 [Candidatus Paceibacterota bacterium]